MNVIEVEVHILIVLYLEGSVLHFCRTYLTRQEGRLKRIIETSG